VQVSRYWPNLVGRRLHTTRAVRSARQIFPRQGNGPTSVIPTQVYPNRLNPFE
jgi:hypothetical protein